MFGVVGIVLTLLPQFARTMTLPAPLWLISLAGIAQSGLLLGLAVWAGVALASKIGLDAPAFKAAVTRQSIGPALRPQLMPGIVAGVVGGVLLIVVRRNSPIAGLPGAVDAPVLIRMLYGGITEELLVRWGVMTALAWLAWRSVQRGHGPVAPLFMWLAILVSAVIFAAGHLPAAMAMTGALNASLVTFVIVANTAYGVIFGWLFWRYGLESAIIAHGLAHLVSAVAS